MPGIGDFGHQPCNLIRYRCSPLGEDFPCRRETNSTRVPFKQLGAYLSLETPYPSGQAGLADAEPRGGAVEVQFLGENPVVCQVIELHDLSKCPIFYWRHR